MHGSSKPLDRISTMSSGLCYASWMGLCRAVELQSNSVRRKQIRIHLLSGNFEYQILVGLEGWIRELLVTDKDAYISLLLAAGNCGGEGKSWLPDATRSLLEPYSTEARKMGRTIARGKR
ncbi:hypothetical protein MPTK1_1g13880 [Marchantia polymorpha subsp. ruderalis]|uniref:Uncharacterized protein n=2 Tax=Marchantia polymorpha TaxID=3197 RepID=A0AAF6APW2_MARPO|nr:hypothetical protein MARPO_0019s0158 [Marchantia polymorpha]BBM98482.1 hypothetical protein Mp_1g13880 [Marchantia polymorpha subsp. ruderalis]|eukprot:PTQ44753.1 hypothetical protein MARPO_0019s0158 [Marchantia polymorpha]